MKAYGVGYVMTTSLHFVVIIRLVYHSYLIMNTIGAKPSALRDLLKYIVHVVVTYSESNGTWHMQVAIASST